MDDPLVHEVSQIVIGIFQKPFQRSFNQLCVLWSERKEEHEHPLSSEDRSNLKIAMEQIVENGHTQQLMDSLLQRINDFVTDIVLPIVQHENSDILLDRFIQFEEYIRRIDEWISDDFKPVVEVSSRRQEASPVEVCIDKARKTCFDNLSEGLVQSFLNRTATFRSSATFSYNSPWMFPASSAADPTSRVTEYFKRYLPTEDMREKWLTPYYGIVENHVRAVINGLPQHCREQDFLAVAFNCLAQECLLFKKDLHLSDELLEETTQNFYNNFCNAYDSKVREGRFMSIADVLAAPESTFDETLFSGLTELSSCSYERQDQLLIDLKKGIKANYGKLVDNHQVLISTEDSNSSLESTVKLVEDLDKFRDKLAERLESHLYQNSIDVVPLLVYGNFFKQISDESVIEKVNQSTVLCGKYVCGIDDPGATDTIDFHVLSRFLVTMASQKKFMYTIQQYLTEKIRLGSLSRSDSDRISSFLLSEEIAPFVSTSIRKLLKDIANSKQNVTSFLEKRKEERITSDSLEQVPTIGRESLVLKEQALPNFEENLLILPKEISQLHQSYEEHLKDQLKPEQTVKAVNSLSFVTIKTSLFSGTREYIRIKLSIYQLSVLEMLSGGDEVVMQQLYTALIRPDVTASRERRSAEKVVNQVIRSLMSPYPLIRFFRSGEEVTREDRVLFNSNFVFRNDFMQLAPPNLLKDHPNTDPEPAPASGSRRTNNTKMRIAATLIQNELKRRRDKKVGEEELVSRVLAKAQRNKMLRNIEREDIGFAIASLIDSNKVKRLEEDNSILEYIPQPEGDE